MSLRPRDEAATRRLMNRAIRQARTEWEDGFVSDILETFEEHGWDFPLTEAQWEKLWEIAEGDC